MRRSHNNLINCLKEAGIQPSSFAYFLMRYIEQKQKTKSTISILLTAQLKAQAELILYHMTH
jgi:hypothetical protein